MKLTSFAVGNVASYGIVTDRGVIDLGRRLGARYPTLKTLLAANALGEARALAGGAPDHAVSAITFLPVIPDPDQIFCVGLNYEDHRVETGRDKTANPALFIRLPASQVGHDQPIICPRESSQLDYEAEIAVIIGKAGRRIPAERAYEHVAGYACYNDGSVRDWQRHTIQWTAGKNFHMTGGFGPWMVTADEIPANTVMTLVCRLNGKELQRATTEQMIFKIPRLVEYISTFLELRPGDVIVSGTPGGVGSRREPPIWMKPGDKVEVEIDKVGVLVNSIMRD